MLSPEIPVAPRAWRVEFAEPSRVLPDDVQKIAVLEPRTVTALLMPLAPADAMAKTGLPPDGTLKIVWMPPGGNAADIERDVAEWMRGGKEESKEVNVRAEVRTVRVVWCENRSAIYCSEGDLPVALDAIIRFSVAQTEALDLEDKLRATWATIEADVSLTHALTLRELKMQGHVNRMTEVTTNMKMSWLRLFRSLEQFEPALTNPSKRIFAELASSASLYDRMETLEHTVQFALDHYEISNTRLIDMYLARTDRVNSIYGYGIVTILLLVQIAIMVWEAGLVPF